MDGEPHDAIRARLRTRMGIAAESGAREQVRAKVLAASERDKAERLARAQANMAAMSPAEREQVQEFVANRGSAFQGAYTGGGEYPEILARLRKRLKTTSEGEVRGDIVPWTQTPEGGGPAIPNILRQAGVGLLDTMAAPYTGEVTPEATEFMVNMTPGAGATAAVRPSAVGSFGIFGGQLAKTAKPDLPMDEASRMARALEMGFDRDVYHGTRTDFDKFKRKQNDIGFHFGTAGQANDRLDYLTAVGKQSADGARTMPVKLKVRNPLRMDDIGHWNSNNLLSALKGNPAFRPEDVVRAYQSARSESGRVAALRGLIESKGYDGIVYKNTGETAGGTELTVIENKKYREAFDGLGKKPGKDGGWTAEDQKHPLYKAYKEASDAATRHRETNAEDSFIAFRPNQVRSRFAAFDPAKRDSANLLAANVPTGVGLLELAEALAGTADQSGKSDIADPRILAEALMRAAKQDRRN